MELHQPSVELRGKALVVVMPCSRLYLTSDAVLPAVTIGNCGQLAADLIINTLSLPCVGTLVEPSLLPCVGLGAYDTTTAGTLSTELQLYADAAQGWAIVQQRSPPATGRWVISDSSQLVLERRQEASAVSFADFIAETGVSQVLLLASADAALRRDKQLALPAVRFSASTEVAADAARELHFVELEEARADDPLSAQSLLPPWPLWRALTARGVPALLLVWHASEGDNTRDAHILATAAAQALEKLHGAPVAAGHSRLGGGGPDRKAAGEWAWVPPRSWGAALYGSQRVVY